MLWLKRIGIIFALWAAHFAVTILAFLYVLGYWVNPGQHPKPWPPVYFAVNLIRSVAMWPLFYVPDDGSFEVLFPSASYADSAVVSFIANGLLWALAIYGLITVVRKRRAERTSQPAE